jgi:hypothetical protein
MAVCVFCGDERKLSDEHVFPEWLLNLLPEGDPNRRRIRTLGDGNLHRYKERKRDEGPWSVPSVVKIVCQDHCNGSWMSRLESEAKLMMEPFISGRPREIRTREQRLFAFWATKTMMVLEFTDSRTQVTTNAQHRFLYEHREDRRLPENFRVWMGFRPSPNPPGYGYTHRAVRYGLRVGRGSVDARLGVPNAQQTTFSIGRLVLVVASARTKHQRFEIDFGDLSDALLPIHPRPHHRRWPPSAELDESAIADLANAILALAPQ